MADDNLTTEQIKKEAQSIAQEARGVSARIEEKATEAGQEDVAAQSRQNTQRLGEQIEELGGEPDPIDSQVNAKDLTPDATEGIGNTDPVSAQEGYLDSMTEQVDEHRKRLERRLAQRRENITEQRQELEEKQAEVLQEKKELSEPFRQELQEKKREELYIEENMNKRQDLINEMDSLLQEGNELIRQQKEATGLKAVRNPRVQKTMDEISARAGVIESVLSARKGQIQQAQTIIDRSISAIESDRKDRMAYYDTLLKMHRNDILQLEKQDRQLAEEQRDMIRGDLEAARTTSQRIKELLTDPGKADLMGQANIKLTDSPQEVSDKLSEAQYNREVYNLTDEMRKEGAEPVVNPDEVPEDELVVRVDSRGNKHYFRKDPEAKEAPDTVKSGDITYKWDADKGEYVPVGGGEDGGVDTNLPDDQASQLRKDIVNNDWETAKAGLSQGTLEANTNKIARIYAKAQVEKNPDISKEVLEGNIDDAIDGADDSTVSNAAELAMKERTQTTTLEEKAQTWAEQIQTRYKDNDYSRDAARKVLVQRLTQDAGVDDRADLPSNYKKKLKDIMFAVYGPAGGQGIIPFGRGGIGGRSQRDVRDELNLQ